MNNEALTTQSLLIRPWSTSDRPFPYIRLIARRQNPWPCGLPVFFFKYWPIWTSPIVGDEKKSEKRKKLDGE